MARGAKKDDVEKLMAAVEAACGATARSSLYRWLRENHDEFLARLDGERADWLALAQGFAALGLTDRTGKPAAPATAHMTWQTVRKDVAKAKVRKGGKSAPASGEIAPGVRAAPPSRAAGEEPRPRITLDIRPARPRLDPPPPPVPCQPLPPPGEAAPGQGSQISSPITKRKTLTDEEVEADIRRLLEGKHTPPPKPI